MPKPPQGKGPIQIHITGRSAFPGDPNSTYVTTTAPRPTALRRAVGAIGDLFMKLLPDHGGKANVADDSLLIKTSPVLWEYEQFKLEFDRRIIIRELEDLMRMDPRIKRANRVFAATATRKGFNITVTSDVSDDLAEKAQDIVNQVMRDCQILAKLASWCRILLNEGDLFLNPVVDTDTRRIKNIKRLPAISMQREEDMMGNFQDLDAAFRQIDPISLDIIEEFPLWAINHIRWDHEEGMRYGSSQYLQVRGYWRKLNMTEQDIVLRRRSRATPRRLHSIGTKENPGTVEQIANYKKLNGIDNNPTSVISDFYGNGLTDIKDLDGDPYLSEIKDVEHIQEVYMIGLGVPLHMLGFGQHVNRDVVSDQVKQFKEDTQEARDLLEFGDSSPYSGLRPIFDFALSLQGIDPSLVTYNIAWYASDDETAEQRVDRVIKLRASQPKPLISQRLALQTIGRDLNLESTDAIDSELEQIEEELALDRQDQQTLAGELNPEKPPTKPESGKTATTLTDSVRKKKDRTRLRGKLIGSLEKTFTSRLRSGYKSTAKKATAELARLKKKHATLTDDAHRKPIVGEMVFAVAEALQKTAPDRIKNLLGLYGQAAAHGSRAAHLDARGTVLPMTDGASDKYVNPETSRYLEQEAGNRIRRIDETTLRSIREVLAEKYKNGDNVAAWIDGITEALGLDVPAGRAEMISRTELAFAYNTGLISGYAELGIDRLVRLEVMDNRTCQKCADANEKEYTIQEADGLLPAHPRCRGTWVSA